MNNLDLIARSNFEKAWIDFENKQVHLEDGKVLPIVKMWGSRGLTDNPDDVVMVSAGLGDTWVNLRLLD